MEKYMRNQFKFFGVRAPELRRQIEAEFVKAHKQELDNREVFLEVLPLLWQQEEREFQYIGCTLTRKFREQVLGVSEGDFQEAVACVQQLITTKSWWDTVDALSYSGND